MTRRMTWIVLALLGVMVFAVTIAPPDRGAENGSAAPVTPTPTGADGSLTDPDAPDVVAKLSTAPTAARKTVDAEIGDRVDITVEGTGPDSVSLGEIGIETLDADTPANFDFLADTPGTYPLILLSDDRELGTLEIR